MSRQQRKAAIKHGYRSGLEDTLAQQLKDAKIKAEYETVKIEWEDLMYRTYTPDFVLPNGVIVESKGLFKAEDRRKHLKIKEQHPDLDIRFVFSNSRSKLSKGAKSSYADWCIKHKFPYADKTIPEEWMKEKGKCVADKFVAFPYDKIERVFK